MNASIRLPALLAMTLLQIGCTIPQTDNQVTAGNVSSPQQKTTMHINTYPGTIKFKNLEGGFFALHTQSGERFTLKGLTSPYRRDGLVVEITGHVDDNAITFTQYGKLLIVDTVTVIDDSQANPINSPRI